MPPPARIRACTDRAIGWATRWLRVERLSLTPEQIEEHQLPSAPVKATDTRRSSFSGAGTVEVEALPVEELLAIVTDAIESRIDGHALDVAMEAEASEREILQRIAATPREQLAALGAGA